MHACMYVTMVVPEHLAYVGMEGGSEVGRLYIIASNGMQLDEIVCPPL